MSEQTLIQSPSFGDFLFDAVLNIEHTREVTVTSHPVQYGAEIADHSYIEPETVSLQIGMSDAMSEIGQENHSVNAHAQLVQMMEARELVTLVTRLGTYRDMLIVSMTTPDEFAVMNGIKAQIGFKHINIVTSRVVLIQNKVSSSKGGYKPPETKTDDPEAEDKTENKAIDLLLLDIVNAIAGGSSGSGTSGIKMSWATYKKQNEVPEYIEPGKGDETKEPYAYGGSAESIASNLNEQYPNAPEGTTVQAYNGLAYTKVNGVWLRNVKY